MLIRITILSLFLVIVLFTDTLLPQSFKEKQRKFSRVENAYIEKDSLLRAKLSEHNLSFSDINIILVAFKEEKELELWVKKRNEQTYSLLTTYPICVTIGNPGPKRRQGDCQIPEGFYFINDFNPNSNYHLSLGISYPNRSDKKLTNSKDPGGSIYIHGSCVTIGCLPMTNDLIKEIYIYAVEAKNNGQNNIPVYIFPLRMETDSLNALMQKYAGNEELIQFWINIKEGYDLFYTGNRELRYTINNNGKYIFEVNNKLKK